MNNFFLKIYLLLDRVLLPFECITPTKQNIKKGIAAVALVMFVIISFAFLNRAFERAEQKAFWTDESYSYRVNVTKQSIADLIVHGARKEGSPMPLDYINLRILHKLRPHVDSFGLSFNVYYRLNAIFMGYISGLAIALLVYFFILRRVNNYLVFTLQMVGLLVALLLYLFWPANMNFSVEMRAYSLWNSLWFSIVILYMIYGRFHWPLILLLSAMAATSGAALFQMFSLGFAALLLKLLHKESFKETVWNLTKVFILPLLITAYYMVGRKISFGYGNFEGYMQQFWDFWTTKEMIPILSLLGIAMTCWIKRLQSHTIVFASCLILYLISPLINYIVLSKGFFFTSRYYRYYDLIYPIFMMSFSLALPVYIEIIRGHVPNSK